MSGLGFAVLLVGLWLMPAIVLRVLTRISRRHLGVDPRQPIDPLDIDYRKW